MSPRASRICPMPGCPNYMPCSAHARPNATARGYDHKHRRRSEQQRRDMPDGQPCSRCGEPMRRGEPLHLDHDDSDRGEYLGLSHARCNTSAGGRAAHAQ